MGDLFMSYKTIVTVLDNPDNTRIAAAFSAALAKEHGAHVVGLHA